MVSVTCPSNKKIIGIINYYRRPIGKYHVQVCTTTPCWLRGSDAILNAIKQETNCEVGGNSPCGKFSVSEVRTKLSFLLKASA